MPFKPRVFQDNVEPWVGDAARDELARACEEYDTVTVAPQKARCIRGMMDVLERDVEEETRRAIMEACGRRCIGAGTLGKPAASSSRRRTWRIC